MPKDKKIEDFPELEEYVGEFFDTLDYDGSGTITSDELRQLEMNVTFFENSTLFRV